MSNNLFLHNSRGRMFKVKVLASSAGLLCHHIAEGKRAKTQQTGAKVPASN